MAKSTQEYLDEFMADFEKGQKVSRDKRRAAYEERKANYEATKVGSPEVPQEDGGDFSKGVSRGIDQTQALGYGVASLLGDAVGSDSVQDWGMEGYKRNMAEAEQNKARVGRIEDIDGIGDAVDWGQGILGELVPSIVTMAAGGGIGGAIAKQAAKKAVGEQLAKKVATGQIAGAAAASVGMETGEIYGDVAEKGHTGAAAIVPSVIGGTIAGTLDTILPMRVAKAFGFAGGLKKEITGKLLKRARKEGLKGMGTEAGTEFLQTIIEEGTKSFITKEGLPDEIGSMLLNATAAGALGGGIMGGAAGAAGKRGPIEDTAAGMDTPVPEGYNPVTKEEFGNAQIAKLGKSLAELDKKIKAGGDPNLVKQAATVLDEIDVTFLQDEVGPDGKKVKKKPLATKEAQDLMDFYGKDYRGKASIEITDIQPETNEQREARLKDEASAKAGKAKLDKEQEAGLKEAETIAAEEQQEEVQQATEKQAVRDTVQKTIEENAREIVTGTPAILRQAGDTAETLSQREPHEMGPRPENKSGVPKFLQRDEGDSIVPRNGLPGVEEGAKAWDEFNKIMEGPDDPAIGAPDASRVLGSDYFNPKSVAPGTRNVDRERYIAAAREDMEAKYGPEPTPVVPKKEAAFEVVKGKKRTVWHGGTWDGTSDFVNESGDNVLFAATAKKYAEQYAQEYDEGSSVTELNIAPNKELNLRDNVFADDGTLNPQIVEVLEAIGVPVDKATQVSMYKDAGAMKYLSNQTALLKYAKDNGYQSIILPDSNPDLSSSTMTSVVVIDPAIMEVVPKPAKASNPGVAAEDPKLAEVKPDAIERESTRATTRRPEPIEKAEARAVEKVVVEEAAKDYDRIVIDGLKTLIQNKEVSRENLDHFLLEFSERTDHDYTKDADKLINQAIEEMATGQVPTETKPPVTQKDIDVELSSRLDELPLADLRKALKGKGVKGAAKMNRADLVEAVNSKLQDSDVYNYVRDTFAKRDAKGPVAKKAREAAKAKKEENKAKLNESRQALAEARDLARLEGDDPMAQIPEEEKQPVVSSSREAAEKIAKLHKESGKVAETESDLTEADRKALKQSEFERQTLEGLDDGEVDFDDFEMSPDSLFDSFMKKGRVFASLGAKNIQDMVDKFRMVQKTNFDSIGRYLDRQDTPGHRAYSQEMKRLEHTFKSLVGAIRNRPDNVEFVFLDQLQGKWVSNLDIGFNIGVDERGPAPYNATFRGLHAQIAEDARYGGEKYRGKTVIFMNPHKFVGMGNLGPSEFIRVFLHEFVGHYGMRRLFEATGKGENYNNFLDGIAETNENALQEALMLRHRWTDIKLEKGTNKRRYITKTKDGKKTTVFVSREARRRLMDEFLAEKAKEFSDPEVRKAWSKEEKNLIKRFITWVRHKLRPFSKNTPVSDADIMAMVANSYENLYGEGVRVPVDNLISDTQLSEAGIEDTTTVQLDPADAYNEAIDSGDLPQDNMSDQDNERIKALKQLQADGVDVTDALATDAIQSSGYSKLRQGAVAQMGAKYYQKFQQAFPGFMNFWSARGTLRNYDMKNAQAMNALGKMGKQFKLAKDAHKALKGLTSAQGEAVMEYMTDDRANIDNVNLPEPMRRKLVQYKQAIIDMGEKLVQLDMLDPQTYYANMGKYLPARYLAYAGRSTGSGRKASPLHYLMKQGNLNDEEKTMLGEVLDPQFIIPEAISLIGRDVALLEYMETIRVLDKEGNLGWILGDKMIERFNPDEKGMPAEISVTRAEEMMEVWKGIVIDYETGGNTLHQSTEADITGIKEAMTFTQKQLDDYNQRLEHQIRKMANIPLSEPIPQKDFESLIGERYKKMPGDRGYGALKGQWVRKEIYDEFTETAWFQEDLVGITKALGPGGIIDRGNQLWKTMKVPFNLPSWLRNGVGNFVLMDIASKTSSPKLMRMFSEEVKRAMDGDPSAYFREAHKRGLFGTTFSSNEIFLLSEQHNVARRAKLAAEMKKVDGTIKSGFLKGWGAFVQAAEITSQGYGNLEGIFKTVAMRDYIEQWKTENGVNNLEDLTKDQERAVVNEAVIHANKAIFDYSELTAWQKDLRRSAFGAPFITYTMKALPAVMRGVTQNPQKFIKYLAMPYAFSAMSMAGMGDVSPEELEEWTKKQPQWMKDKSSVHVLPFKDGNGKLVPMDFGYWFPWAPWSDLALKTMKGFKDKEGPMELALATKDAAWEGVNDLGLLGGPVPTSIAALLTGKETFLGRDIVSEGDSASVAVAKQWNWLYTMMAPPFLTNQGVSGKLMDHFDLSITGLPNQNVDALGGQKATMSSSMGRAFGVSTYPTSIEEAKLRKVKSFRRELRALQMSKSKVQKNQGWSLERRVKEIKDVNRRIILLKKNFANDQ